MQQPTDQQPGPDENRERVPASKEEVETARRVAERLRGHSTEPPDDPPTAPDIP